MVGLRDDPAAHARLDFRLSVLARGSIRTCFNLKLEMVNSMESEDSIEIVELMR